MHQELWQAQDPIILNALRNKVSGERIQAELLKMITHWGNDRGALHAQSTTIGAANKPLYLLESDFTTYCSSAIECDRKRKG